MLAKYDCVILFIVKNNNKIKNSAERKQLKKLFRIGENEKEIIKLIGIGTIALSAFIAPGMALALKPLLKERGENGLLTVLRRLNNKKVVDLGGEEIKLTEKGKKLLKQIHFFDVKIEKPKKWDGLWHMVSYDIPNINTAERNYFRRVLKNWGFYQIQASLWVYPYECKEEVAALAEYLKISEYIAMMNTDLLPNEDEIESHFNFD